MLSILRNFGRTSTRPAGVRFFSSGSTDYYQVLGLTRNASEAEIKKAYKAMALKHHPDRGGNEEIFKKASKAYEVLSDPQQRQYYDQYGEEAPQHPGQGGGFHHEDPFELFKNMFGGGGGRQRSSDIQHVVSLSLEEIREGVTRSIRYQRQVVCQPCKGQGGTKMETCGTCKGSGVQIQMMNIGGMKQRFQQPCSRCSGQGKAIPRGSECGTCRGSGISSTTETLTLQVPPMAPHGHELRFPGKAHEHPGVTPGDVVVYVEAQAHPLFCRLRNQKDLGMPITLNLAEALQGFSHKFKGLDQKTVEVYLDQCLRPNQVLKVPNQGLGGDLYLLVQVEFPKQIDSTLALQGGKLKDILKQDHQADTQGIKCETLSAAKEAAVYEEIVLAQAQKNQSSRSQHQRPGDQASHCHQQ